MGIVLEKTLMDALMVYGTLSGLLLCGFATLAALQPSAIVRPFFVTRRFRTFVVSAFISAIFALLTGLMAYYGD